MALFLFVVQREIPPTLENRLYNRKVINELTPLLIRLNGRMIGKIIGATDRTRHPHKNRRYKIIPYHHRHRHHQTTQYQRYHSLLFGFMEFIPVACYQNERSRCKNMHQDTDKAAASAYRHALNDGSHHCQCKTCQGTIGKGAQKNGDICRIVFQKCRAWKDGKSNEHQHDDGECDSTLAIITSRWVFCWRFLFFLFRSTTNKTTKNNANTDQRMIFVACVHVFSSPFLSARWRK